MRLADGRMSTSEPSAHPSDESLQPMAAGGGRVRPRHVCRSQGRRATHSLECRRSATWQH